MQQYYDVTQFEYVLWGHTMPEWVMNIHFKTWIAQGRFTNMILTPSKQRGVCDNKTLYVQFYFFWGNINMYQHFMSFLHIDMPKVIEIRPRLRLGITYFT